jgi:hypothetical protein
LGYGYSRGDGEEYDKEHRFFDDTISLMDIGQEVRPRHLRLVVETLTDMGDGTGTSIHRCRSNALSRHRLWIIFLATTACLSSHVSGARADAPLLDDGLFRIDSNNGRFFATRGTDKNSTVVFRASGLEGRRAACGR